MPPPERAPTIALRIDTDVAVSGLRHRIFIRTPLLVLDTVASETAT